MADLVAALKRLLRQRDIWLLCLVPILVYGNTLFNGFVYDDHSEVVANEIYRNFDLQKIFLTLSNGLEYLPLRDVTYAVDYAVWRGHPWGFHASNLIYFLINLMAAYYCTRELARFLFREEGPAPVRYLPLVTTLLFAVHPYHSEPVSAIFTRNVLVSGMFFFGAVYAFLAALRKAERPSLRDIALILVLYICAMLSKATTITLPLLFLAIAAVRYRDVPKGYITAIVFPSCAVMAVAVVFFKKVAEHVHFIATQGGDGVAERVAVAIQIPFYYLAKLLVPAGFSIVYDVPFATLLTDWKVGACAVLLGALFAGAFLLRKKNPALLFGAAWYIITLVPVMNLLKTNIVVADRYFYLPLYGLVFIVVSLVLRSGRYAAHGLQALVLAVLALSIVTVRQNMVFRNDITLWEHAVAVSPADIKSLNNLGWSYYYGGAIDKSFAVFARLRHVKPDDINLDLVMGFQRYQQKDWLGAISSLERAREIQKDSLDVNYLIAMSYKNLGDYPHAIDNFERLLQSKEQDYSGYRQNAQEQIALLRSLISPPPAASN